MSLVQSDEVRFLSNVGSIKKNQKCNEKSGVNYDEILFGLSPQVKRKENSIFFSV